MVQNLIFMNSLRRSQNKEISFPFFAGSSPDPSTENMIVRKFLCFVCRVERGSEARIESPRARMRTLKFRATARSARDHFSRFATGKMFEFHHIDGAIQNKAQILVRLWRRETENPRGFSTVFATKRIARDPAKVGSMFSEHSSYRLRANLFSFAPQKLKQ